jgi:hypothetical protein
VLIQVSPQQGVLREQPRSVAGGPRIERELLGRNALNGRWSFQVIEDCDDTYWSLVRTLEKSARDQLADGRWHLYEARLKQQERRRAGWDMKLRRLKH